jgi:acetyltransferase-like isoleucine patch superfamily enzyme
VLKSVVNRVLLRVRPGKQIADEVDSCDLVSYLVEQGLNLIRGTLLSLPLRHRAPCFVGRNVRLRFKRNIEIGRYAAIGDGTILSGLGRDGLRIGNRVNIGAYARLVVGTDISNPGSHIFIGDGCGIGEYSSIGGSGGVSIGSNTIIGQHFTAHPENHNFDDVTRPIREQGTTRQRISIGSDCWFGARVTVLAGVTIGDGCVVAAGAVVRSDVPALSIVAGVPARVVGTRKRTDDAVN